MNLIEKSKKQIKKDFEKMMVKFKNNFNEINIKEKMDEIVVDNTIKNKKELVKWCYLKENSTYMLNSEFDSDTHSSLIDVQRGALQIYLYGYIYELFENKKRINEKVKKMTNEKELTQRQIKEVKILKDDLLKLSDKLLKFDIAFSKETIQDIILFKRKCIIYENMVKHPYPVSNMYGISFDKLFEKIELNTKNNNEILIEEFEDIIGSKEINKKTPIPTYSISKAFLLDNLHKGFEDLTLAQKLRIITLNKKEMVGLANAIGDTFTCDDDKMETEANIGEIAENYI